VAHVNNKIVKDKFTWTNRLSFLFVKQKNKLWFLWYCSSST